MLGKCFRSSSSLTNPRISPLTVKYECPQPSLLIITSTQETNKMDRGPVALFHANVFKADACLKHSNFLKVKVLNTAPHSQVQLRSPRRCQGRARYSHRGRTGRPQQKSNYELFNHNNFNIRYWSWNYRGCWHQTCPPIDTRKGI